MLWKCRVQTTPVVLLEKKQRGEFIILGCTEHEISSSESCLSALRIAVMYLKFLQLEWLKKFD